MSQTDFIKYIRTPEFKALLNKYEEALNSGVDNFIDSEDLVDIAEYYHYSGMMEKAEEAADYCLEQYPDCATALYFKSRMELTDHSNPDEAMRLLKRLPEDDDNVEKTFIEAEVKIVYGDSEGADKILRERYARLKSQVESQDGIYGGALDSEYDEESDEDWLLEDYSHFPLNTAMIFCDHCCFGYAEKWMKMMDKPLQDMLFEYWETWGRIYLETKRTEEAIKAWNNALDIDAYNIGVWVQLGNAQYIAGKFEDCLQSANFALAIEPDLQDALNMKGASLYSLDRIDEAMELFCHYADVYPDDPQADIFLGTLYFAKNDSATGMDHFSSAIDKSDYDVEVIIKVSMMLRELTYVEQAYKLLRSIEISYVVNDKEDDCPMMLLEALLECCKDLGKDDEYTKYKERIDRFQL